MLDGLNDIDWASLAHAYGSAEDVPGQLRALLSPEHREGAMYALYGNIFHQGTRYEATPHAVPFLVELIEGGVLRAELLDYLKHLVAGYLSTRERGLWCDGQTLHDWMGEAHRVADLTEDLGYGTTPQLLGAIWARVAEAMPLWLSMLSDEDPAIRGRAAVLLSLFHGVSGVTDALRARLSEEPDGAVRADLCFALHTADPERVVGRLTDSDLRCRFIAAVCLPEHEGSVPLLITGLGGIEGLDAVCCAEYDGPAVASAALLHAPREDLEAAIPQLIDALQHTAGFALVPVVTALLSAAFPAPRSGPLTEPQRAALTAMVHTPYLWKIGNLWEIFRSLSIPHSREKVAAILEQEIPADQDLQAIDSGLTYLRMGFQDKAVQHFDEVKWLATFDQHPHGFEALVGYASATVRDPAHAERSVTLWEEVAARAADPAPAMCNRALAILTWRGRAAEVEALEEVTERFPEHAGGWHSLGIGLRHLDRFADALAATDRAIALEPAHRDAWWNRGSVLSLLGRADEAIEAVRRCLQLDPSVAKHLLADDDFDPLRDHPDFTALLSG